jgi:hypothetical protein
MAFNGYYLKINGTTFPNDFINIESLGITPDQILDDDAYTDADGVLHRSTLPHRRTKIEFNTPDKFSQGQNQTLQTYFTNMITIDVEYWNPKINGYSTGTFYSPDIDYTIKYCIGTTIYYNPIRIALIEY